MDCWFKCDKGWFGVGLEYQKHVMRLFYTLLDDNSLSIPYVNCTVPLYRLMEWADGKGIPYEITTVKPVVKEIGKDGE